MGGEHPAVERDANVLEGGIRVQNSLVWGDDPEQVAVRWSGI